MMSDDEGYIGNECRLALGPCECPTGNPYREPPSRLYRTTRAPEAVGPYISRDWFFYSLMRAVRNMTRPGMGKVDSLGEPLSKLGPFVRVYRYQ